MATMIFFLQLSVQKCVYLSFPTYNEHFSTSRGGAFAVPGYLAVNNLCKDTKKILISLTNGVKYKYKCCFSTFLCKVIHHICIYIKIQNIYFVKERKGTPVTMKFTTQSPLCCMSKKE